MKAHPLDILLVALPEEAQNYPEFEPEQVRCVESPGRLAGIRRAYYTSLFTRAADAPAIVRTLRHNQRLTGRAEELYPADQWLRHAFDDDEASALVELEHGFEELLRQAVYE